jgi:hypothetical protein
MPCQFVDSLCCFRYPLVSWVPVSRHVLFHSASSNFLYCLRATLRGILRRWHAVSLREFVFCWRAVPLRDILRRWHAVSLREFVFCRRAFFSAWYTASLTCSFTSLVRILLTCSSSPWNAMLLTLCCTSWVPILLTFCFTWWIPGMLHLSLTPLVVSFPVPLPELLSLYMLLYVVFFWGGGRWGMMCNLKILLMKVSYFELWLILLLQNKSMSLCNNISHIPLKTEFIVKSTRVNLMPWRFERERKKSPTHSLSGRLKRGRAPNGEIKWPFIAAVCSQLHTPTVKMIMISRVYVVSYKRGSLHLYLRDYWRLEFHAVFC